MKSNILFVALFQFAGSAFADTVISGFLGGLSTGELSSVHIGGYVANIDDDSLGWYFNGFTSIDASMPYILDGPERPTWPKEDTQTSYSDRYLGLGGGITYAVSNNVYALLGAIYMVEKWDKTTLYLLQDHSTIVNAHTETDYARNRYLDPQVGLLGVLDNDYSFTMTYSIDARLVQLGVGFSI